MEPDTHNVVRTLLSFFQEEMLVEEGAAPPAKDQDLFTTGIVDSLNIMRLVVFVGEQFDVQVGPADLKPDNFRSLGAIAEFVRVKQADRT